MDPSAVIHPKPNRALGELRASFVRRGERTHVDRSYEAGGLRLRFPKVVAGVGPDCEAVCINTAGGMVGGDGAALEFRWEAGARATITTQSAEKIYRADGATTSLSVDLTLEAGAEAEWLPQETILFDQIDLSRRLEAELAADARLLMAETLVFGRLAMGESVNAGALHDRWRIRRDGRLVFAEDLRLRGAVREVLNRSALGDGARAVSTVLLVAPDAEAKLDGVREAFAISGVEAGASAWDGLLILRALSPSPDRLRALMVAVLRSLRGGATPRVWQ